MAIEEKTETETPIKVEWSIAGEGGPINAHQVKVQTPDGTFYIGVDNAGKTHLSSEKPLNLRPVNDTRVRISEG